MVGVSYSSGELYLVYVQKDAHGNVVGTPVAYPIMSGYDRWKVRGALRAKERLPLDEDVELGDVLLII